MQPDMTNWIEFVKVLADELVTIRVKVEAIESGLAQADKAGKQLIKPIEPKINGNTKRAMQQHAPPLSVSETQAWREQIKEGRRFTKKQLASKFFPNDAQATNKAARVCYWLKREGILFFDQSKWQYYRPVSSDVNAGKVTASPGLEPY